MTTVYVNREEELIRTEIREFHGCRDTKGRTIGARAIVVKLNFTPRDETSGRGSYGFYAIKPEEMGVRYAYRPHALRNGASFGSSQGYSKTFATHDEVVDAVTAYFKGAAKRAQGK